MPTLQAERFRLFGVRFSDKTSTYLIALALACSEGPRSLLPAAASALFGVLYAWPRSPLARVRFPKSVRDVCRAWVLPLVDRPPPPPPGAADGGGSADDAGGGGGGGGGATDGTAAELAGQAAAVDELVAMGFERRAAEEALLETGTVAAAANRLLGEG